jgi:hypothetical protein
MTAHLHTLWVGSRLRYLERLSIQSAQAAGHELTLWSYEPGNLAGVPPGVSVRDAREVMSDPRRTKHFEGKFKAFGADFFRYEIFAHGLGCWMDLDVIVLEPLEFTTPHVFGWERADSVNTAVLRIPNDSPMLTELRSIPHQNWRPPFFGPRRTAKYFSQRVRGNVELEDLPWGVTGPGMVTYLVRKYGLLDQVQPQPVFYPVRYDQAEALFDDATVVEHMLTADTVAIHMWNSRIHKLAASPPHPRSFVGLACERFGVDVDDG